jgi:hypothetical protein
VAQIWGSVLLAQPQGLIFGKRYADIGGTEPRRVEGAKRSQGANGSRPAGLRVPHSSEEVLVFQVMSDLNHPNNRRFKRAPIILGGCPRSCTSLLLSVLSLCPNIYCIPEETWAFYDTDSLPEFALYVQKWLWPKIPPGTETMYQRWCEKTPMNVLGCGSGTSKKTCGFPNTRKY